MKQESAIIVLFGATGDLTKRKIIPGLFNLHRLGYLGTTHIIAFARRPLSDKSFQEYVSKVAQSNKRASKKDVVSFIERFSYHQGNFEQVIAYKQLKERVQELCQEKNLPTNLIYYLAVPPEHYGEILDNIRTIKFSNKESTGWTRILLEKPFGTNETSARQLDSRLAKQFTEDQIYRVDHYLVKEMVQGILNFRFTNTFFERGWDNQTIESISIQLNETIGVDDRANFYDGTGALRDTIQNHLLQLLALLTIDNPKTIDELPKKKAAILQSLPTFDAETAAYHTVRGQYLGYPRRQSATETYAKLDFILQTPRWRGVPITLETGKKLPKINKQIIVTFKHPVPCLYPECSLYKDRVIFTLEPKESIKIEFWIKKPGLESGVEKRELLFFLHEANKKTEVIEEYGRIIADCLRGNQSLFVSTDEIQASWRFIDQIRSAWDKNTPPLIHYKPGTLPVLGQAQNSDPIKKHTIGLIGLGKMGGNLARQLQEKNWQVIAYNRTHSVTDELAKESGLTPVMSIGELIAKLPTPRIIWLMLPAGEIIDEFLFNPNGLISLLDSGDIIIEGANSNYNDTLRRAKKITKTGINFIDVGVSGGPGGARTGACLMVGGEKQTFQKVYPLLSTIALPGAIEFFEGYGAGHFVKMVHNGIEYGMMQAIAEGFEVLKKSHYKLDLQRAAAIYNNGSVIESRLTNWLYQALTIHGVDLKNITSTVAHTGEGAWTIEAAKLLNVKVKIIEGALQFRKQSAKHPSFTGKVLSALRGQFGGHAIK